MIISKEKFAKLVAEAMDEIPEEFMEKMHNVAIFVEDYPTKEQFGKTGRNKNFVLFGLFEGYAQAKKLNFGPVLPDKITIFRKAICDYSNSEEEIKQKVISTVKHEIAHHFGSDEIGAGKAGKRRF